MKKMVLFGAFAALVSAAFAAEKYDANTNAYWEATAVVPAPKAPATSTPTPPIA